MLPGLPWSANVERLPSSERRGIGKDFGEHSTYARPYSVAVEVLHVGDVSAHLIADEVRALAGVPRAGGGPLALQALCGLAGAGGGPRQLACGGTGCGGLGGR